MQNSLNFSWKCGNGKQNGNGNEKALWLRLRKGRGHQINRFLPLGVLIVHNKFDGNPAITLR